VIEVEDKLLTENEFVKLVDYYLCLIQLLRLTVCRLYHHTTPLSALKRGSDYSLFRGGLEDMAKIRPEWEDDQNRLGGCWKVAFDGRIGTKIDDIFRELVRFRTLMFKIK
jgi:hypothetical protein